MRMTKLLNKLGLIAASLLAAGCAMFAMPDLEELRRREAEAARTAVRDDPSPVRRAEAAELLGRSGDAGAVPLLVAALADPESTVRRAAAEALRELREVARSAAGEMLAALQREKDPGSAVAMGWALHSWHMDVAPGAPSLRAVLSGRDPLLRYHAALLLDGVIEVEPVAQVYIDTLGTKVAADARTHPADRLEGLIGSAGDRLLPLLVMASTNAEPVRRAAVAALLGRYKPLPAAAEASLIAMLKDPDARVREAAAWACYLCEPMPAAAAGPLIAGLKDASAPVRANCARGVGQLIALGKAPSTALDVLSQALEDSAPDVRAATLSALAHMGPLPKDITFLVAARLDARAEMSADVRAEAANALFRGAHAPEVRAALLRGLDDAAPVVVERSLASIGHLALHDEEVLQRVAERTAPAQPKGFRLLALGALGDIGGKAAPVRAAAERAATDPDGDIREGAARALQRIDAAP